VLSLSLSSLLIYKSSKQKQALDAIVQSISLLIVVLPIGRGKTLLLLAAAILNNMQQSNTPSIIVLILPFRAIIKNLLIRLGKASIKAVE
jgi:predicted ribonuclease YlaK